MTRILVVDDEPDLCEILCFNLENEGFETEYAYSAESALSMIQEGRKFDLLLLDVMMESMSGFDMVRKMRAEGNETPVIFLTARSSESDLLAGFESGGDDYIPKPFSFPTVLARVKAVLKRTSLSAAEGIGIDKEHKTVLIDGQPVTLTKKEFLILSLLSENKGIHFTREQIIGKVWDEDTFVSDRSVDVHIARLRKKLGPYADRIVNHTGFGYVYVKQ
jgi:DNA-binding response OmpR family regulator